MAGLSEKRIAEHQQFAAQLCASIRPTLDTGVFTVNEVADRVAQWVQRLLTVGDR